MGNCISSKSNQVKPVSSADTRNTQEDGNAVRNNRVVVAPSNRIAPLPDNAPLPSASAGMVGGGVVTNDSADVVAGVIVDGHIRDESGLLYKEATSNSENLVAAVKKGDIEKVKLLLQDRQCDVDVKGMWGSTPLITATQYNSTDIAKLLLEYPTLDINHRNEKGASALLYVCMDNNMIELVKLLLSRGADPSPPVAPSIYNAAVDRNVPCTPLSVACSNGCDLVVHELITTAGCDVNTRFNFNALPASPAVVPPAGTSIGELTPLMIACSHGKISVVSCLLELGADIQLICALGNTCVHYAARSGKNNVEVLNRLLAQRGVEDHSSRLLNLFTTANLAGDTVLHVACDTKALEFVKVILLLCGQQDYDGPNLINIKNTSNGFTALHTAVKRRSPELVSLLIENNADPLIEDSRGLTPLDMANQLKKDSPILQALESAATAWRARKAVNSALSFGDKKPSKAFLASATETIGLIGTNNMDSRLQSVTIDRVQDFVLTPIRPGNQTEDTIDTIVQSSEASGVNRELLVLANSTNVLANQFISTPFPHRVDNVSSKLSEPKLSVGAPVRPTQPSSQPNRASRPSIRTYTPAAVHSVSTKISTTGQLPTKTSSESIKVVDVDRQRFDGGTEENEVLAFSNEEIATPELIRSVTPVMMNKQDSRKFETPQNPAYASGVFPFTGEGKEFKTPANKGGDPLMLMSVTPSCIEAIFEPTPRR